MPSTVDHILDEVEALLTSDSPVHQVLARVRALRAEHAAGDQPVDASGQALDYDPEPPVEQPPAEPDVVPADELPRGAAGDPVRGHDAAGETLDYHATPAASSPPSPTRSPEQSEQAAPPESPDALASEQAAATGAEPLVAGV